MLVCNHHAKERDAFGLPFPVLGDPCQCVATYEAIVRGETIPRMEAFCAIVRESARHPDLLTAYASDLLVWDRASLTDYAGPFLWVLRDYGTVLLVPQSPRVMGRLTVRGILNAFGETGAWFWWDGGYLRAVTPKEAGYLVSDAEALAESEAREGAA